MWMVWGELVRGGVVWCYVLGIVDDFEGRMWEGLLGVVGGKGEGGRYRIL